jgi:hypothetical protein
MNITLVPSAQIAAWNAKLIPEAEAYRRRWSWAAFLNPVLWPLTHGYALLSLTEFASLLVVRFARPALWTLLLWLGILLTRFVLGIVGNRLALNGRRFESADDFVDCEKAWQNVGIILFAIGIAILIVRLGLHFAFRSS